MVNPLYGGVRWAQENRAVRCSSDIQDQAQGHKYKGEAACPPTGWQPMAYKEREMSNKVFQATLDSSPERNRSEQERGEYD